MARMSIRVSLQVAGRRGLAWTPSADRSRASRWCGARRRRPCQSPGRRPGSGCPWPPAPGVGSGAAGRRGRPMARCRSISSRLSLRCSTRPRPHSTTVTARIHGVFQVDVVNFRRRSQPVGVHVDQVRAAGAGTVGQVGMDADQDKGGRNDAGPHPQALAQALGEGGFAGTQLAGQHQQVPGLQYRRQSRRERVGLVRRRRADASVPSWLRSRCWPCRLMACAAPRTPGARASLMKRRGTRGLIRVTIS